MAWAGGGRLAFSAAWDGLPADFMMSSNDGRFVLSVIAADTCSGRAALIPQAGASEAMPAVLRARRGAAAAERIGLLLQLAHRPQVADVVGQRHLRHPGA